RGAGAGPVGWGSAVERECERDAARVSVMARTVPLAGAPSGDGRSVDRRRGLAAWFVAHSRRTLRAGGFRQLPVQLLLRRGKRVRHGHTNLYQGVTAPPALLGPALAAKPQDPPRRTAGRHGEVEVTIEGGDVDAAPERREVVGHPDLNPQRVAIEPHARVRQVPDLQDEVATAGRLAAQPELGA